VWVRSQNKELLANVKDFEIRSRDNGFYITEPHITKEHILCTCYGIYPTKEQAIEVLGKIQSRIETIEAYKIETGCARPDFVFQMPQPKQKESPCVNKD